MITARTLLSALVWLGIGHVGAAHAQSYPDKPVKLILPYTAGSPNDVLARLIAPPLSTRLRQSVIVENRPGGGTSIGVKAVIAAEPDGYTLLYSNTPVHLIAPLASRSATFDPIKDFVPIAMTGTSSLILVISPAIPANTIQEFVAYAKANPGKLSFGYGRGTLPHLVGEMFKIATATDIASIPYRGGAQAVPDILGGRIHMNFGTPATLVPLIRDGKLRALAITSAARYADLPNVPTMIESGLPNVTAVSYYGILGPAGTPAGVVTKINAEMNESLKSAELQTTITRIGFGLASGSAQDFATLMASEMLKWAPVVKSTGFRID